MSIFIDQDKVDAMRARARDTVTAGSFLPLRPPSADDAGLSSAYLWHLFGIVIVTYSGERALYRKLSADREFRMHPRRERRTGIHLER